MDISIRVASTELELNEVFNLRYKIFCEENARIVLQDTALPNMVVDQYDTYKSSKNIIAYEKSKPIGVVRINFDSAAGLPAEASFDLTMIRRRNTEQQKSLGSVSMLAIVPEKRNSKLLHLMFDRVSYELQSAGVETIVANISNDTYSIYKRMGFVREGEPKWSTTVNDRIALIQAPAASVYSWFDKRKTRALQQQQRKLTALT